MLRVASNAEAVLQCYTDSMHNVLCLTAWNMSYSPHGHQHSAQIVAFLVTHICEEGARGEKGPDLFIHVSRTTSFKPKGEKRSCE